MKQIFSRPFWIVTVAFFFLLSGGAGIPGLLDISMTSTAFAKSDKSEKDDKSKKSDKDKSEKSDKSDKGDGGGGGGGGGGGTTPPADGSGESDGSGNAGYPLCDPQTSEWGICAHQGFMTVIGMKNQVWIHSTTGSIRIEVTSPDVNMNTGRGDTFAMGLTQKGKFTSDTGHIKIHYCKIPAGTGENLLVNNQSTGDVDIRLLEGTDFDYNITNGGILKNEMGDCDSCTFKINGAVAENVFVSVLPLVDEMADNNCLY